MAKYAIGNDLAGSQQAIAATYKTLISVFAGSTARRGKIYDVLIGTNGTPADNYLEWDVSRMTADGTGSSVTPNALDPADSAALGTRKANYTVEPTVTAASSLFYVGVNQRASYRSRRPDRSSFIRRAPTTASSAARAPAATPAPPPSRRWWRNNTRRSP